MDNFTENFFKKHKDWIDRNKEYLQSSNWIDLKTITEVGKGKKLLTANKTLIKTKQAIKGNDYSITKNLLGRLKYFIDNTPGEKHLVRNKEVVKYLLDIILIFPVNCDTYLEENPIKDIENQRVRNLEIKFQDSVFNDKIKIEDGLQDIGAFSEHEDIKIKFYRDDKASLVLREPLILLNQDVKVITENSDVNWELNVRTSNEMFINMKPKDVPPWNHRKHFFEQETSTIQFWTEELDKIKNGVNIAGYFIHPWLYFHLNFFKTPIPQQDGSEPTIQPGLRDNEWFFAENLKNCINPENPAYYSKAMLVYGTRRFAKALRDDQDLHYTDGSIRPIGLARVGDEIFGSNGFPTKILGVYPQGKVDLYEIELGDGRKSVCCDEHLWTVYDYQAKRYKVLPLKELMAEGWYYNRNRIIDNKEVVSTIYKYFLPINSPVKYKHNIKLSVDPYYLGLWLGDGTKRTSSITTEDPEILSYVKDYTLNLGLAPRVEVTKSNAVTIHSVGTKGNKNILYSNIRGFKLNIQKHIPNIYKTAPVLDRMNLLQGLMDTDGTINKGGSDISYCSADKILAEDVLELCRSLGIHAKIKKFTGNYIKKDGNLNTYYKVIMFTNEPVFRLKRKRDRIDYFNRNRQGKIERVPIINIKKIESENATCIRVDNKEKEFITNDFIVTHNSVIMASLAHWRTLTKFNSFGTIVGGNSSDLSSLTSKVKTSMTYIERAFKLDMMKQNWENGETTFGIKEDVSSSIIFSTLIVQNLQSGAKGQTQRTAGLAPSVSIYDEIGKYAFLKGYLAALPSFKTPYGFKCVTVLAGCVCAGTKVWNSKGKLLNIEDLTQEEGILGYDGKGVFKEKIEWFKAPEKKPCYRIETTGRNFIECSSDHPLLWSSAKYRSNNKKKVSFKLAKDLKVGEQLMVLNSVPVFGRETFKEARLLGLLIGDGNYSIRATPTLSCGDEEIFDYIKDNYGYNVTKEFKTKNGGTYRSISLPETRNIIKGAGIHGQTKLNKRLPTNIHKYNEASIAELLGGYFDADGNVYYNKSKNSIRVVLTSICEDLLIEVKYQLLKLGVGSSISKETRNTKPSKGYEGQQPFIFRLYINRRDDVIRFKEKIKFLVKHKQSTLNKVDNLFKGNCNIKLNPCKFELDPINKKGQYFVGKNNLEKLRSERITKIEFLGDKDIYNMHTKTTNTYLSNGFVTKQTGGEADLSIDAMHVLGNPEAYDLLPMDWDLLENKIDPEFITWKRRNFATFFPGQMAYEDGFIKVNTPFGKFLRIKSEELDTINIEVTDWDKNNKLLDDTIAKAKMVKGGKGKLLAQQKKVQYPRDPEDCFITIEGNPFPSEEAKQHKNSLEETGDTGKKVLLKQSNDGTIGFDSADHLNLAEFPHNGGYIDAPVVLYEGLPDAPPPYGLYVAGLDDYKHDVSSGDSIGSMTIYKREWFDPWSLRIVASYHSRPNPRSKFDRQCYYLLKAYNAVCFPENEDNNFKIFLDNKHETELYMAKGLDFASELNLNNNGNRVYGWAATTKNIEFGYSLIARYLNESDDRIDEDGNDFSVLGVQKIPDIGLLEEIAGYTKDGNFDRLRSFMGALLYSHYLDKIYLFPKPASRKTKEEIANQKQKVKKKYNAYRTNRGSAYRK